MTTQTKHTSDPSRTAPSPPTVTIAVIAASQANREALVLALRAISGLHVLDLGAGTTSDLEQLARLNPGVVLLDLAPVPAVTITRDIMGLLPSTGILALNQEDEPESTLPLLESGIAGLTLRSATLADIVDSIHAVIRGEFHCPPIIAGALVRRARERTPGGIERSGLTPRERQVLTLVQHGHSQKEVATLLNISPSTVRVHVHSALKKLTATATSGMPAGLAAPPLRLTPGV